MIVQVKVMRLALSSPGPFPTIMSMIRDLQIHLQPASSRAKAKQHAFDQVVSPPHGSLGVIQAVRKHGCIISLHCSEVWGRKHLELS